MCIIASQTAGMPAIDRSTLGRCWLQNSDGAGFMFVREGKLVIRKPFWKFCDFLEAYETEHAEWGETSPFVLHFRWATHGNMTAQNTHPHVVIPGRVGVVHNGVLPVSVPKGRDVSDTVVFTESVLADRQETQLMGGKFRKRLRKIIGKHNKLVFLSADGLLSIVNEKAGIWDGGVWYSNCGYLEDWGYTPKDINAWTVGEDVKGDDAYWAEKAIELEEEEFSSFREWAEKRAELRTYDHRFDQSLGKD